MWSYVFVIALMVAFIGWFIFTWHRDARELKTDARAMHSDIESQTAHPMKGMQKKDFVALYSRVHRVRRPAYLILFFALAAIGTVPTLMLMSVVREYFYYGPIIWGFQTFFALILFWVAALAITLRIYHARKPGTLEEEFRRSRS